MRLPITALFMASFLAGCASPVVTVASLVADGVSYVATGKSTTDHAISAFAGEDCALLRIVEEEAICDPDGDVLVELVGAERSEDDWYDPGDLHLKAYKSAPPRDAAPQIETAHYPL